MKKLKEDFIMVIGLVVLMFIMAMPPHDDFDKIRKDLGLEDN